MNRHEEAIEAYAQAWYREERASETLSAAIIERDSAATAKQDAWNLVKSLVKDDQMPPGVWAVKAQHPSDKANAVIVDQWSDAPVVRPMYRNIR